MLNLRLLECTLKGYDHISDLLLAKYWVITGCKYRVYTGLTSLEIPGSITEIGYDAFYGCPNLKDVFIDAKQSSTIEFLLETIPQRKRITLHVPVESEYADLHGEATKGFKAVVAEKWK